MFIILVGGDKKFANQLVALFTQYLAFGYTYHEIKEEILITFYTHKNFRWDKFKYRKNKDANDINLLKPNQRYYHKELKIVSKPPTIDRNIDHGTLVSRTPEYFLEPVASYTIQELVQYFIHTMPLNISEWPLNKTIGMLKYKVNQFGLDRLLFMIDMAAEDNKANQTVFDFSNWDMYANKADQYLEEMKYSISDNEQYYTPKKRNLFNERT